MTYGSRAAIFYFVTPIGSKNMYFLIYGDDTYRSRKKLAAMRRRFSDSRDSSGLNSVHLLAKDSGQDKVAEALFSTPFLSEKKLVILEGFLKEAPEAQARIRELLERKPDSTSVIFFEDTGAQGLKKTALFDDLVAGKYTVEHAPLTGPQAARYIRDFFKGRGLSVTPGAVRLLSANAGGNLWQLENDLEKVCAYASSGKGRAVDENTAHLLVSSSQEESVFAFLDACTEGRGKEAVRLLEGLFSAGMSEIQVTAMLTKQFRTLIAVRDLMDRGIRDKAYIAKELSIHQYPASKAMVTCRRFSMEALQMFHDTLIEIDGKLKTGAASNVLLNVFTTRLTAV